ncbi:MAG: PQQ-binding-like beta-propeller repeat protein [Acidobacteriota bacterium]
MRKAWHTLPAVSLLVGVASVAALFTATPTPAADPEAVWNQYGGPHQDFVAPAGELASAWPAEGPRTIWSRPLGDGYSAIVVQSGRVFTMYRAGEQESIICMNASTGKTVWEYRYDSAPRPGHAHRFGDGPRSTPLLDGGRIYTIGVAGVMHALDRETGDVIWSHDLWTEFDGNVLPHGYASSPIAYGDTIITLVGGTNASIVAFDKKDGAVAWKALNFENSYSTPRILKIGGTDQLVTFMATELIGVDPLNGELLWQFHQENQYKQNVNMPTLSADGNYIFLSSPHAGAHGLKLTSSDGKTQVEEVWSEPKIQFYHVSTVREGDWVYGSTGTIGPAFLTAVNIKTGKVGWRDRGFAKANCLDVGGRLMILDEDGNLALATATPEGLTVHARAALLERVAWTTPTVVGTTLFVRDKKTISAVDLS